MPFQFGNKTYGKEQKRGKKEEEEAVAPKLGSPFHCMLAWPFLGERGYNSVSWEFTFLPTENSGREKERCLTRVTESN